MAKPSQGLSKYILFLVVEVDKRHRSRRNEELWPTVQSIIVRREEETAKNLTGVLLQVIYIFHGTSILGAIAVWSGSF